MKKILFLTILAFAVLALGCKQINQIVESVELASFTDEENQSADYHLVRAYIQADTETIDKILASGEKGEIIDLVKSFQPALNIRTYSDILSALCLSEQLCGKENADKSYLESCAETRAVPFVTELKTYPGCEKELREFYTVTSLCMLDNSVCVKNDTELLLKNPEQRNKDLIARSQNSFNCMSKFMKDINARTTCITSTPRFSQAELDKLLKLYCDQAVSCHVYDNSSPCVDKYKGFFKNDKHSYHDCTNQHLTYMVLEFQLMDFTLKALNNSTHNVCEAITDYEKSIHPEEIFDQSSNIQEYNQKTLEVTQDLQISWLKLSSYMTREVLQTVDYKAYYSLTSEQRSAMTYYSACRISNMGAK